MITNPDRHDGFGSQYQTIIYSAIFASLNNQEFMYEPFKQIEHNYDNDPDFNEKIEKLINFKDNFKNAPEGLQDRQKISVQEFIKFFEDDMNQCLKSEMFLKIKGLFYLNKVSPFQENTFNIAIHIRRNNDTDNKCGDTNLQQRYLPDLAFVNIIKSLLEIYSYKDNLTIHIYSQGHSKNFKVFQDIDSRINLHLDGPVTDTFISLVYAEVLVISPSSLSYVSGLLSNGRVFAVPFWHKLGPNWTQIIIK